VNKRIIVRFIKAISLAF